MDRALIGSPMLTRPAVNSLLNTFSLDFIKKGWEFGLSCHIGHRYHTQTSLQTLADHKTSEHRLQLLVTIREDSVGGKLGSFKQVFKTQKKKLSQLQRIRRVEGRKTDIVRCISRLARLVTVGAFLRASAFRIKGLRREIDLILEYFQLLTRSFQHEICNSLAEITYQ